MTSDTRLAELWRAVSAGHRCLAFGYGAARFYGSTVVETADHSLYAEIMPEQWPELKATLKRSWFLPDDDATPDPEEITWKGRGAPAEVYRITRANPLLPDFEQAWARRSIGVYGDERMAFLSLNDLMQSLESNQESDWRLLGDLEQLADEQRLEACEDRETLVQALANMRSSVGFERAHALGYYSDADAVAEAALRVLHPVSQAFLLPFLSKQAIGERADLPPNVKSLLKSPHLVAHGAEMRHLGLVEAVRRAYRLSRMNRRYVTQTNSRRV